MRRVAIALLVLLAVLLAAAGGIAWFATQPAALAWALERGAAYAGGRIEHTELTGTFFTPIGARRLVYEDATIRVEITGLDLAIASLREVVLDRRLVVERLGATTVDVLSKAPPSNEPAQPPATLALPIDVSVQSLAIGRFSFATAGSAPFTLGDLRASWDYAREPGRHRLALANVVTDFGRGSGEAEIADAAPFVLAARVALDQPGTDFPYAINATAGGDLSRIGLGLDATVEFGTARGAAVLQPFANVPVERILVTAADIDPKRIDRRAPSARLSVEVTGALDAENRFDGQVSVRNAQAGPIDRDRIPVVSLTGRLAGDAELARLTDLEIRTRTSVLNGRASLSRATVALDLRTGALDVAELVSTLRSTRLAGDVSANVAAERQTARGTLRQRDLALDFDLVHASEEIAVRAFELRAGPGTVKGRGGMRLSAGYPFEVTASVNAFDPSALGSYPAASITGALDAKGTLDAPRRIDGRFRLDRGTFRGYPLEGEGAVAVIDDRITDLRANLAFAKNRVEANGAFGAPGDVLRWSIAAPELGSLGFPVSGRLAGDGTVTGSFAQPVVDFSLAADALRVVDAVTVGKATARGRYADGAIDVQASASAIAADGVSGAALDATLVGTPQAHRLVLTARAASPDVAGDLALAGGVTNDQRAWRGTIEKLETRGRVPARLIAPVQAEVGADRARLGAAEIELADGRVRIARFERTGNVIDTAGSATGVSLARLLALADAADAVEGDVRLGATWRVVAGPKLDADVRVMRESGDLRFPRELAGERRGADRMLGITRLEASARAVNERIELAGALAGARIGAIRASLAAPLVRDGTAWRVPREGRLAGEAVFEGGELASLRPILPEDVTLRGSADGAVKIGGTVAAPRLAGALRVERAVFAIPEQGVRLSDGRAELRFTETGLRLVDARFAGERGTITASGNLDWNGAQPAGAVKIVLAGLDAITDPVVRVSVSGEIDATIRGRAVDVTGRLRADEGAIRLPDYDPPTVSSDVVVKGREKPAATDPKTGRDPHENTLPNVDLALSLGDRFTVTGRGVDAKLAGDLRLQVASHGVIRLTGTVRTTSGTVTAYGQTLRIESGTFVFNGAIDNPALNITAIRPNIPTRVGITITGFAQAPRATLFSDTAMTNTERLAWLVLGRSPDNLTPTDLALIGAAAAGAVLGGGGPPITSQIASKLGLDEIAVKTMQGAQSAVVAVGKRISDRLYVSFEQALGGIGYAIKLRYELSRNWSIQTQAGFDTTVDLLFTKRFD